MRVSNSIHRHVASVAAFDVRFVLSKMPIFRTLIAVAVVAVVVASVFDGAGVPVVLVAIAVHPTAH